ncbi:MAG TPA: hypothetical protein VGB89_13360, partial [Bacteroidota bacterium]
SKVLTRGDWVMMDVNRISTPIRNNGSFNRDPNTGNAGFEWPKGTGKTANYASGLWLGGKVADDVRVAAAEYSYEFDAGSIINNQPANPADSIWRVYSIKRGDNAANNADYAEWPWQHGAPSIIAPDGSRVPEMIGDQTVWCVFNDADSSIHTNFNSLPLGVEVQLTAYAYVNGNQLGDNIFFKWMIINKSGETIDSMYVTIWSDVDLGDSGDDLDGCDTTLGLGYTYNDGVDGVYGSIAPATGFVLLQGPLVPGTPTDTARFPDGRVIPGMKELEMTSFIRYGNDGVMGNPNTPQEVLFYQQGINRNGQPIRDNNGNVTKFMFPGDPNLPLGPTNWIETPGMGGERRFMVNAGPFTFGDGEMQEIVAANLIAVGDSPTQSVTALKDAANVLAGVYASNYRSPDPPLAPIVSVETFDKEIYLNWNDGEDASQRVLEIESTHLFDLLAQASGAEPHYDFEGYVVYQYDDALGSNPRIGATFDRADNPDGGTSPGLIVENLFDPNIGQFVPVVVKYGTNIGVSRSLRIRKDIVTGDDLVNARDYYFGVTSYLYNAGSVPKTLESSTTILIVRPGRRLGIQPQSTRGDTITVARTAGSSDGFVRAFVTDPHRVTGDMYSVYFFYDSVAERTVWNVDDLTTGGRKIAGQVNQTGDEAYPTFDGIQVKVFGPAAGMKGAAEIANANGPHDPTQGCFLFNGSGFPTIIPCDPIGAPCDRPAPQVGGDSWGIHTGTGGIAGVIHYPMFVSRVFRGTNFSRFVPYDFEIRFTAAGGLGYMRFSTENVVPIPFELWNIGINTPTDPSDDYRMVAGVFDSDGNDVFNLAAIDHPISGGDNDPETDWIYWYDPVDRSPGQGGYNAWAANSDPEALLGDEVIAHMVLVNFNGGSVSDSTFPANLDQVLPETGTVIRIISTKPNQPNSDVFTVNTAGLEPLATADLAKADINRINVVPNPYLGASAYEKQLDRVLRFTNLPVGAKVRIFTLAGALVQTIENSGPGTTADWDLQNEKGNMVASGMYIAHVDIPGIGSKILKIAVIL